MAFSRTHSDFFATAVASPRSVRDWRARDRLLEGWMRFGQLARGLVYLIPGAFALRLAIDRRDVEISQNRAITIIAHQPGWVRALFDPLGRGRSVSGILTRLAYLVSGLAYAGLLWFSVQLILGSHPDEQPTRHFATAALRHPHGAWLVIAVGACWIIGGGIAQITTAVRAGFMRDLDLGRMGAREHHWARHLGRVGLAARAVVFAVIGVTLVGAGLHLDPAETRDLGGALMKLLQQPFGRPLLTLVALG
ncbi:MAG: DUF1206 domain-containing protein, partial [Candidatus Eisenbacteria bacterium]